MDNYRVSQKKQCISFLCILQVIIAFTHEFNIHDVTYFVENLMPVRLRPISLLCVKYFSCNH